METNSVNTVQEIINKRANERLVADIEAIGRTLGSHGIAKELIKDGRVVVDGLHINLYDIFFRVRDDIYHNNIKKYIEEETKLFMQEFNDLKERVKNLENGTYNE